TDGLEDGFGIVCGVDHDDPVLVGLHDPGVADDLELLVAELEGTCRTYPGDALRVRPGHTFLFLLVGKQIGDLLVLLHVLLGINIGVDVFLGLGVVRRLLLGTLGLLGVLLGTRGLVGLARASLGRLLGGVLALLRALLRLRSGIGGLLAVLLLRLPLPAAR